MTSPGASKEALARRGEMLRSLRKFFYDHEFVEVETPLLSGEVIPELHIEPLQSGNCYLQASPELHMKQLVANGMPAIFQVTRSFRGDELGRLHNPEFTIVEWYRVGDDMLSGMQLLDELCQSLLGTQPAKRTSYAEAFEAYVGLCCHASTPEQLASRAKELNLEVANTFHSDERDEWLNLLLSFCVEPNLGTDQPEILFDYPASQAALAKTASNEQGIEVAKRFELYWQGIELANGYDELTDAAELRRRLGLVNKQRVNEERTALPLPESLLDSMATGLPACAGCALGFDRLVMLACDADAIAKVIAFPDA